MGRGLYPMPWFLVNSVIKAANDAEDVLGHPPTLMEILVMLKKSGGALVLNDIYKLAVVFSGLFREDMVFVDSICYRWTAHKKEGFFSYTELFVKNFGTGDLYTTRSDGAIVARQARTVNYSNLV